MATIFICTFCSDLHTEGNTALQWYKHCPGCHATYLDTRYSRWQHKSFVVAVYHDHNANGASRQSPRVLEGKLLLLRLRVLKRDVKHLREVLAQMMGRGSLEHTVSSLHTAGHYLWLLFIHSLSTRWQHKHIICPPCGIT